ncbi:MAG: TIGR02452 family protein, partial [Rivularia sp. ALOHA_DT_140]|nr:TIGR02452 family protein [Rivularia sp. ALOHA_DT_140]
MNKNRNQRAAIAKETVDILNKGFYQNNQQEAIYIQEELQTAIENSIHYSEEDFSQLLSKLNKKQVEANQNQYQIQFEINNETTLNAANRLINQEGYDKVLCLNFASAKNPGGGFLNGSQAQEESLARATGLYPCIFQMTRMYEKNRYYGSCLYLDDMIYSPQVPVIRDDDDNLLDKPFLVSILTVPAVNTGAVKQNGKKQENKQIEKTMLQRS